MIGTLKLALRLFRKGLDPTQVLTWLELRRALADCDTLLDVGCGDQSNVRCLQPKLLTGIEGYPASFQAAQSRGTHDNLVLGDVRELRRFFSESQFEACVALDVIEHLTKVEGHQLIRDMEHIASRKVVFLTPSGFLPQRQAEHDDLQAHLSGWEAADMRALGYRVVGLLGPKSLRGEHHVLRRRPKWFWGVVSLVAHFLWTRHRPESSAAILCIKDLAKKGAS